MHPIFQRFPSPAVVLATVAGGWACLAFPAMAQTSCPSGAGPVHCQHDPPGIREDALVYRSKGYGALALDQALHAAASGRHADAESAKAAALKDCGQAGGQSCRVAMTFKDWCVAAVAFEPAALGGTPRIFLSGGREDGELADQLMQQCQSAMGGTCRRLYADCPNL